MSGTLTLNISEKTKKKLGVLAVLTGRKFDDIEGLIVETIDQILTNNIKAALADMDGEEFEPDDEDDVAYTQAPVERKTLSKKTMMPQAREEEVQQELIEDLAGNSVSDDEDEGSQSLEEQYNQEEEKLKAQPPKKQPPKSQLKQEDDLAVPSLDAENVDGDYDSFLDEAITPTPTAPQITRYENNRSAARRSFNPQNPKVRVSGYTGDETSGDLF